MCVRRVGSSISLKKYFKSVACNGHFFKGAHLYALTVIKSTFFCTFKSVQANETDAKMHALNGVIFTVQNKTPLGA